MQRKAQAGSRGLGSDQSLAAPGEPLGLEIIRQRFSRREMVPVIVISPSMLLGALTTHDFC